MSEPLLTPNTHLYVMIGMFCVFMIVTTILYMTVIGRLRVIENQSHSVKPLWKHVQSELFAIMRHPHEWAVEMDALMDEAEQEPEVHMAPERYQRFIELLAQKVVSDNPDLRPNEKTAAAVYLALLPLIRGEEQSPVDLTGIRLVGSQAPEGQTSEEVNSRAEAK